MRRTIVDPRFCGLLANLMMGRGMSQAALARQAPVSAPYLSQIINGHRNPSAEIAHALDAALDAGGRLAGLVTLAARADDLDQLAAAVVNPRHVSAATVDALDRALVGQRFMDDTMGSAALVGPVMAQMESITAMVTAATGPHRHRLLLVAGQWGQFVGWLHTSTGHYDKATEWFGRALQWATMHGDRDLIATVLSYQAHVAWLTCQWAPALDLANAALRDEQVYPGQRAYDAYQAARAHAALGDVPAAEQMLGVGNELAELSGSWAGEVPAWQYYRAPWFWQLERGLVLLYIARWQPWSAANAVAQLRAGVDGMPEEYRGADWFAEYLTHLGTAHLYAEDMDAAGVVLARAREVAEVAGSARVLRMVEGRERRLLLAGLHPTD